MVLMYNWKPLFDFGGNIDTSLVTDVNKEKKLEIAVASSLCTRLLAPFRSKYKSNHQSTRTFSYQDCAILMKLSVLRLLIKCLHPHKIVGLLPSLMSNTAMDF